MDLTPQTLQRISEHATISYPAEICGFIINDEFVPAKNSAEDPRKNFRISPEVRMECEKYGKIQAVIHSHPYNKFDPPKWPAQWPSSVDMQSWMQDCVPWGIVACDGEGITKPVWLDENVIAPLEGREFVHGIWDCYSVIRDWFRLERNITLPNYPRSMEWWRCGGDLYSENFSAAGFTEINKTEAAVGDVVLMKVHSPVICHAAVITGTDEILHHLFHRLSGYDSLQKWDRQIMKVVRYIGAPE